MKSPYQNIRVFTPQELAEDVSEDIAMHSEVSDIKLDPILFESKSDPQKFNQAEVKDLVSDLNSSNKAAKILLIT